MEVFTSTKTKVKKRLKSQNSSIQCTIFRPSIFSRFLNEIDPEILKIYKYILLPFHQSERREGNQQLAFFLFFMIKYCLFSTLYTNPPPSLNTLNPSECFPFLTLNRQGADFLPTPSYFS